MDFDFILNEAWSVVSNYNPTMRVHSIVDWDYKYDVGSFWSEAGVENVLYCGNSMNTDWFDSSAWLSFLFQQNPHSIFICRINCNFTRLNTIFMQKTIRLSANIILVT